MVSRNSHCDSNRLRAFLDSPPTDDGGACDIAEHLEHCEKCRNELEAMAGGRWWHEVRPFVRPESREEAGMTTRAANAPESSDPDLAFLSPPDEPGHLGRFGPYQVIGVLGKGGMGVVLKAIDPALRRTVAIKVLSPVLATSGASRARFTREAQAAAAVVHNHVVAIFHVDTDEASGLPYLVMPCIVGRSLQERIDRDGPLAVPAVLRIGMQAAAGLAAAHAQGIVHRDIKPANILLENGVERVVLTDFSLARAVDDASLTQSGVIAGTPQYMSPEQARGESTDLRSDLFSLGSVLYAMCTGRPPFRASSALAVLRRVSDEYARPVRELNPAIPEDLAEIIDKLHAKDPAERYQSATEVSLDLEHILAEVQKPGRRAAAVPPVEVEPLPRRKQWQPSMVAAAIVVVLAGVVVLAFNGERLRDRLTHFAPGQGDEVVPVAFAGDEIITPKTVEKKHSKRKQLQLQAIRNSEGQAAAVAACADTCSDDEDDDEDEDGMVLRLPKLPRLPIELPFGVMVRFEQPQGRGIQVVVGSEDDQAVAAGKTETRAFPLKDFRSVDVRGPYTLELKQGKEFKVSITTDDTLFQYLQVEKEGNKLIIGFKHKNVRFNLNGEHVLKAAVTMPDLESLFLSGAARASASEFIAKQPVLFHFNGATQFKGAVKGEDLTIDTGGASTVNLSGSGTNLKLMAHGASHVKLADFAVKGDRLIVDASGASFVDLKGTATAGVLKANGASHLNLRGTKLAGADITVGGASHAVVTVTEKLDYAVSGASHLSYYGDPAIGKSEKSGSSHVSQMR